MEFSSHLKTRRLIFALCSSSENQHHTGVPLAQHNVATYYFLGKVFLILIHICESLTFIREPNKAMPSPMSTSSWLLIKASPLHRLISALFGLFGLLHFLFAYFILSSLMFLLYYFLLLSVALLHALHKGRQTPKRPKLGMNLYFHGSLSVTVLISVQDLVILVSRF